MIQPNRIFNKRIGFSVLNWGLGHVSRCITVIKKLEQQNNKVFIFCDGVQKSLLEQYSLEAEYIDHEGYPFLFRGKGNFKRDMLLRAPKLFRFLRHEQKHTQTFIKKYELDCLISDQRYGFYSKDKPSIFITHQMKLPTRGIFKLGDLLNEYLISKFDAIWIVDDEHKRFAGRLSVNSDPSRAIYIGVQSRFELLNKKVKSNEGVLVINGPKEYTEYLIASFNEFIDQSKIDYIVGPKFVKSLLKDKNETIRFIANDDMAAIDNAFQSTKHVYGFFGYSTLMDCITLNVPFTLIPTPGQDEQIYLAKRHKKSP